MVGDAQDVLINGDSPVESSETSAADNYRFTEIADQVELTSPSIEQHLWNDL
jgi:hypothetical protein